MLTSRQFDSTTVSDVVSMAEIAEEFNGAHATAGKALVVTLVQLKRLVSCGKNESGDFLYRIPK